MTIKLGYLVRFRNGQDAKNVEDPNGEYPIIGSGGAFSRANEFLHDGESLLFGRKGTIDRPLHVNGKFWTVDTMYYTEIGPEASGRYLYYWATTIPFDKISTQTALPSMTSFKLSQLEVPLPDLPTQHRIADYLDRETAQIDAMTEELDALVARLKERRTSIIEHSVTGPSQPLAFAAREIVDCVHTTPVASKESDAIAVRTSSVRNGRYIPGKGTPVSRKVQIQRSPTGVPRAGDIFFTREAPAGEACVVPEVGSFCLGQRMVLIRVDHEKADPRYLTYCIYLRDTQADFNFNSSGSTVSNLKLSTIRGQRLPLPPLDEQRRIADHLDAETAKIDAMIAKVGELRALLDERRSALITATVTGQHPVPEEP